MAEENNHTQMEGLATLLVLTEEIRSLASIREFGFFSTNETHRLIPYHTSFLWQNKEFIGTHLVAQSGTAEIDIHAPANQWIIKKINEIKTGTYGKEIHQIDLNEKLQDTHTVDEVPENLSPFLLWCPLLNKNNELSGGLIFFREFAFTETDIKMLSWLIDSYQYTWLVLVKPQKIPTLTQLRKKPYLIALAILALAILFFPTRLSVLGDGTVVAESPALINAPMEGVIKSFAVNPGDKVRVGQLLLSLDKTDVKAAVEVNKKNFLLTQAKLRAATSGGFNNAEAQSEIPIIQGQLAIDKANLDYSEALLAKTDVTSPINGIVIFESKEDWVGQPLRTGERILVIANPSKVEVKIHLPIANTMQFKVGEEGEFFLYGSLAALPITIKSLGYNAKMLPNKILAYQLGAYFNDKGKKALPQLGAQGTVKIYGQHIPLIYYLFRRPLQALRQMMGI